MPVLFTNEIRCNHVVPIAADQRLAAFAASEALEVEDVRARGSAARVLGRRTSTTARAATATRSHHKFGCGNGLAARGTRA